MSPTMWPSRNRPLVLSGRCKWPKRPLVTKIFSSKRTKWQKSLPFSVEMGPGQLKCRDLNTRDSESPKNRQSDGFKGTYEGHFGDQQTQQSEPLCTTYSSDGRMPELTSTSSLQIFCLSLASGKRSESFPWLSDNFCEKSGQNWPFSIHKVHGRSS